MKQTLLPALSHLLPWLAQIVGGACRAVAARGGRDHATIPLVRLAWTRLSRTLQRFERLLARVAAGRAAPVRQPGLTRAAAMREAGAFRLPRGFAWLVVRMPETAAFGTQLQVLLDDPAMAALLAAEPGAVRILRPMCRMLGLAHPAVGTTAPKPRFVKPARAAGDPVSRVWAALRSRLGEVVPDPPPRRVGWRRWD